MFAFRAMRDPDQPNPVPKGREAHRVVPGEKTGLLGHTVRKPRPRSALRLREPKRLPRPLTSAQAGDLLESLRTWRDRAIAGLMLYCGLRSCEVLALEVFGAAFALGLLALYTAMHGRGATSVVLAGVLVTLLVLVILDLDRPTRGLIRVPDAPLTALRASMELPPAAHGPMR